MDIPNLAPLVGVVAKFNTIAMALVDVDELTSVG